MDASFTEGQSYTHDFRPVSNSDRRAPCAGAVGHVKVGIADFTVTASDFIYHVYDIIERPELTVMSMSGKLKVYARGRGIGKTEWLVVHHDNRKGRVYAF